MRGPCPPHCRVACALALLAGGAAWAQRAAPPPASSPVPPQTLAEFLDSLSDNAINADPSRIYRVDGQRRTIRLAPALSLSLDERTSGRLSSAGTGAGTAGPPGKIYELVDTDEPWRWRLYSQRDSTGRENGLESHWRLTPGWELRAQTLRLSDNDTGIIRRDSELALRHGPESLWVEALVRRASLADPRALPTLGTDRAEADFAGLRTQWQPDGVPGLALLAQAQRRVASDLGSGDADLAQSRTEVGADYSFTRENGRPVRLYWREATQLGLLSSSVGLDERSTYRRVLGSEFGDGSPDGWFYLQLRQRSLADSRDALVVAGWRHAFAPASRWRIESLVEQAQPIAGPSAIRSTTLGLAANHDAHPQHTMRVETEVVRSSLKNSAYVGFKYTNRFSENSVTAWRLSTSEARPKDGVSVPTNDLKASAGWGWREPSEHRFVTLWRWTTIGHEAHADPVPVGNEGDRIAHILLTHWGWTFAPDSVVSLRASRRWDRDDDVNAGAMRTTNLVVLRGALPVRGRWSLSAHAARRTDRIDAVQTGFGAEIGYKLSDKAVLALGYNPRGVGDSELAVEDKLAKGFTLRLRFSIEAALARWLDPPWP